VLILGVGIGMASAMWTVFNAVLVQRLPVLDQDRIILPRTLDVGGVDVGMSPRQLPQLGKAMRTVSSMAGIVHWGTFPLTDEPVSEPPERIRAWFEQHGHPGESASERASERLWVLDVGETRSLR